MKANNRLRKVAEIRITVEYVCFPNANQALRRYTHLMGGQEMERQTGEASTCFLCLAGGARGLERDKEVVGEFDP